MVQPSRKQCPQNLEIQFYSMVMSHSVLAVGIHSIIVYERGGGVVRGGREKDEGGRGIFFSFPHRKFDTAFLKERHLDNNVMH